MDERSKQITFIGNGSSEIPRPEDVEDHTEGPSTSSPENTASELANTLNAQERPKDPIRGLALLQSRFFDLQSPEIGIRIILEGSDKGNLYAVFTWPGHRLGVEDGHILADGIPVLKEE